MVRVGGKQRGEVSHLIQNMFLLELILCHGKQSI